MGAQMTETKLIPFTSDVKLDYQGRTIEGYAAAFGNVDLVNDVLHQGAFSKTLQERGGKIKFLWQHDTKQPIGRVLEMNEDPRGLFFKAIISDTQTGRDALALLRDGAIDGMSIGYDPVVHDYSKLEGKTVRNLREVKLYEISLCTLQANPEASVTALKEQEQADDYRPLDAKPYPAEHAARIVDPAKFIPDSFRRRTITEGIDAIFGKLKDDGDAMVLQAYRFDKERYTAAQARAWLKEHDAKPIEFEAAADKAEDAPEETKAGRIIAKRNAERLKTIRRLLQELVDDGGLELDDADEDEPKAPAKRAAEDKPPTDGKPTKAEAGPDTSTVAPPTINLQALALEIESETLRLLEV